MIYNYILSTGDTSMSGSLSSGYANQKDFSANFLEDFYYDSTLITGVKNMQLASNGQTFFEEIPTETEAINETVYQIFSGDFFLKTGASDELDRNKIFGSSTTPFKAGYNVVYEKYTGKSAIGLGTAAADLGPALNSGISGVEDGLTFIDYDYFLNGQKVYSGVGVGVSAGIGTQFVLNFDSSSYGGIITTANKSNFNYDIERIDHECMQYTHYGEGSYYHWHVDGGIETAYKPVSGERTYNQEMLLQDHVVQNSDLVRKLSFVLQLSNPEDYDGGELQIEDSLGGVMSAPKTKGIIIFFDSRTRHRVSKVTRGLRKSLVGWVVGHMWK